MAAPARMQKSKDFDAVLYQWFEEHADDDGFVDACIPRLATNMNIPTRTLQSSVSRLEETNRVYRIDFNRFVVVDKCE